MSRSGAKQNFWREVLDEVNAQQTIIDSILHPDSGASTNQAQRSTLPTTSLSSASSLPQRTSAYKATPQRRTAAASAGYAANQMGLLSPCLDINESDLAPSALQPEEFASRMTSTRRDGHDKEQRESTVEGGSKVVEALVEALSTSSWSSESDTALPGVPGEDPSESPLPGASVTPAGKETNASRSSSLDSAALVSDTVAAQRRAMQAGPFYLRATQIAAGEFEERQRIMFAEFAAVTELISLFVCHMSQTPLNN